MYIVGITGKMGSGKSTAALLLKKVLASSVVLDVDSVAKAVYKTCPDVVKDIRQCFGDEVFCSDGAVDFKLLAKRVFSSRRDLCELNRIMFPEIEEKVLQFIKKQSRKKYLILDAAILFNSNLYKLCNYIMLLKLSAENRRKFLLKKTGFDLDEINRRISGQYIKIKRKLVDCTIQNNGTTMDLFKKVKNAAAEIAARNS